MIIEDYVSLETAKLLKEKGFKEWCYKCYGTAVYHKGAPISFDEECELKDEGLEYEIEYVEGGYLYDCSYDNSEKDTKVWAAPTLWVAMKWLRKVHNIHVVPKFDFYAGDYTGRVYDGRRESTAEKDDYIAIVGNDTYEEACEAAIKYCLENLI